ncbi:hypothetical protein ACFLS0_06095 [Candidatus Bipolaricaulota bacterium]
MHTISMLRRTLGLSSDNQVRNRIERIRDLLSEYIRRGPNNQIFLTDPGLDLMRQLQELYDTGLTLSEASDVLRANSSINSELSTAASSGYRSNDMKQGQTASELASALQDELTRIRKHIAALEKRLCSPTDGETPSADVEPWWSHLREDIDVT